MDECRNFSKSHYSTGVLWFSRRLATTPAFPAGITYFVGLRTNPVSAYHHRPIQPRACGAGPNSVMQRILRLVLTAAKCLGLMSPSLTTDTDGLLSRSAYHSLLELVQMFLLLALSYEFYGMGLHFVMNRMSLLRFWIPFAVARISETWTIRFATCVPFTVYESG